MGNSPASAIAQIVGRNQGPELFFQQPFAALNQPIIPRPINLNRPLERVHVIWRGRVVFAVANLAAVASEAPQTIIQRVRITGTHRKFGALTLLDMSGASVFAMSRLFGARGAALYINNVLQPAPGVPFQQVGATFGNIGTFDLEIHYDIPMWPWFHWTSWTSQLGIAPFLLRQEDFGDTLQLQLFFGDSTSFGTPGAGTTTTFSSFGSGAGTPLVTIETNYSILGPLAGQIPSAVLIRNEQTASGVVTAAANGIRLLLLQKQKTTNVLVKTGTLLAGTSAGVSVFSALQDAMLDFTQIVVDNKPIRNVQQNFAQKEYAGYAFNTFLPGGYLNFPFLDSQNPLTFYRGDKLPGGANFEVDTNVLTTNAQNAALITQEQVYGDPQGAGA